MTHELNWKQFHHGYLGAAAIVIGLVFGKSMLLIGGIYVLHDDLSQHLIQWATKSEYQSPLKILYGYFYRKWAWVRKVNEWLDNLCKRL